MASRTFVGIIGICPDKTPVVLKETVTAQVDEGDPVTIPEGETIFVDVKWMGTAYILWHDKDYEIPDTTKVKWKEEI